MSLNHLITTALVTILLSCGNDPSVLSTSTEYEQDQATGDTTVDSEDGDQSLLSDAADQIEEDSADTDDGADSDLSDSTEDVDAPDDSDQADGSDSIDTDEPIEDVDSGGDDTAGDTDDTSDEPDGPLSDTGDLSDASDSATDVVEDTCDGSCAPRCGSLPLACSASEATPVEHYMATADGCVFALEREVPDNLDAVVDVLAARMGGALGVGDILDDLNRSAQSGLTSQTKTRLRNHDYLGFRWNSGDMDVSYWYPQGITGSSDATESGTVADRRLMLVSWYHKTEDRPTKGARISLADITNLGSVAYRHLLLVEPTGSADSPDFESTETGSGNSLHAGGMVWYGDFLFVADTTEGFRVFDLSRIMQVPDTDDNSRIGVGTGRIDAHGYRYIVPQIMRYRLVDDSCDVRFSFAGLDRSTTPHTIVSGEYRASDTDGRLVSWGLDSETGLLVEEEGLVRGHDAVVAAQNRIQGALTWNGDYYISSSSQYLTFGRLYRTRPGLESRITAWVYGCEDLYYERERGYIWTAAEHPGDRDVPGIPLLPP